MLRAGSRRYYANNIPSTNAAKSGCNWALTVTLRSRSAQRIAASCEGGWERSPARIRSLTDASLFVRQPEGRSLPMFP